MAEFCDGCPLRGATMGELVNIYIGIPEIPSDDGETWREMEIGSVGVLVDEGNHISEPIKLPDNTDDILARLERRVITCDNRDLSEYGYIQRKLKLMNCPALGQLAIKSPALKVAIKQAAYSDLL